MLYCLEILRIVVCVLLVGVGRIRGFFGLGLFWLEGFVVNMIKFIVGKNELMGVRFFLGFLGL